MGVTPKYAVGVWVGNATGEGKPGLVGARTAGPVLFDVFNLLPSSPWFERPQGELVETEICRQSGHLKGRFCEETDTLLILPAGLKTEACPYHHPVTLSANERFRIYENCANSEPVVRRNWFTLPPVWEWYYKQHHPEYRPLPPFKIRMWRRPVPTDAIYLSANGSPYPSAQTDGWQQRAVDCRTSSQSSEYNHLLASGRDIPDANAGLPQTFSPSVPRQTLPDGSG